MKWFHRNRGASDEALKALATAKVGAATGEILRERADKVSAQLEKHRQSNGFSEIVQSMFRER